MSSSPIRCTDQSAANADAADNAEAADTDATEIGPFHTCGGGRDVEMEDEEDCGSETFECIACDERERFALLDTPPVTVLTGNAII